MNSFSKTFPVVIVIAAAMSGISAAQQTPPKTPPQGRPNMSATPPKAQLAPADATFLKNAAIDGMAEIELADVAQAKASNAEVKALAAKIKEDHTNANQELKSLASSKGVTLPDAPDKQHTMTKAKFSKLEGKSFDHSYVTAMVADHRKAVADFTAKTKSGDPDVKAFAEKTLPALKDHLQRAEALQKSVK